MLGNARNVKFSIYNFFLIEAHQNKKWHTILEFEPYKKIFAYILIKKFIKKVQYIHTTISAKEIDHTREYIFYIIKVLCPQYFQNTFTTNQKC